MNNFNSNNEDNETVRQTLTRVAKQYGWFDNPVTMNINGNDVTYYVDQNSPFAQKQQTMIPNRQTQTPIPTANQPNSYLQNNNAQNYGVSYNQTSPWYRRAFDKAYTEAAKLKNEPLYDKYKHSVVSCVGAQDGLYGAAVTGLMGIGKEIQDISRKFPRQLLGQQDYGGYLSILDDSARDLVADAKGIYAGYTNPTDDCYNLMSSYYNPKKKF